MPLQNSQLEKELCLLEFLHIPKPAPSGGSGIKEWETAPLWGVLETEGEFQEELEGFGIWDPQVLHLLGFSTLPHAGFWLFGKLFPSPNLTGVVEKSTQGKRDIPSISMTQSRDQFLLLRFPRSHISGLGFIGSMENGFAFSRGTGKGRRSQPRLPINPGAPGGREFPTGNSLPIVPAPKPATA